MLSAKGPANSYLSFLVLFLVSVQGLIAILLFVRAAPRIALHLGRVLCEVYNYIIWGSTV